MNKKEIEKSVFYLLMEENRPLNISSISKKIGIKEVLVEKFCDGIVLKGSAKKISEETYQYIKTVPKEYKQYEKKEDDKMTKKKKVEKKEIKETTKNKKTATQKKSISNKKMVYDLWNTNKKLTIEQLHKKIKEGVKDTTIKGWIKQWELGKNLPAGV